MNLDLTGQRVLITGGSKGIGRAVAQVLAEEGCDLVLCARDKSALDEVANTIRAKHQVNVTVIAADLSSDDTVRSCGGAGRSARYSGQQCRCDSGRRSHDGR